MEGNESAKILPVSGSDGDRELMAAVQSGDQTALTTLYERHASKLVGVAYRILGNRVDAEDLVHDVFVEAWQRAAAYDQARGSVRCWLVMRVRSRAIDRLRTLATARKHAIAAAVEEPQGSDYRDDPARAQETAHLRRALEELNDAQRTVVELGYFRGLSCREISARCSIPIGTVKSRLSAAVARLRRIVAREGVPDA